MARPLGSRNKKPKKQTDIQEFKCTKKQEFTNEEFVLILEIDESGVKRVNFERKHS
jgi:hypothetical protein